MLLGRFSVSASFKTSARSTFAFALAMAASNRDIKVSAGTSGGVVWAAAPVRADATDATGRDFEEFRGKWR
jgi:hypothetical protein